MSNKKGFTLVEMVVVMGIFITVILISTYAFENIIRAAARETKSVETQIEGLIGLEILRADLQQAGYGLPWGYMNMDSGSNFEEAESEADSPVIGIDRAAFNDLPGTPPSVPPRAVVSGNNAGLNGSDYLVIKSTVLADNATAKKWTYVNYSSSGGIINRMNNNEDLATNERVIVIRSGFTGTGAESRNLVGNSAIFYHKLTGSPPTELPDQFSPSDASENYSIYGIDPDTDPRMPFNRADYYIKKPDDPKAFPTSCNPKTGILYKATCNHGDGKAHFPQPLLDCVADMQVIYFLDMDDDGEAGTYANADGTSSGSETIIGTVTGTLASAQLLRQRLKEIRIYILAQEGGKDRNFSYPTQNVIVGFTVGEFVLGSTFDLADKLDTDWKNYRWKVYTIVVEPKNLGS